ncbi:pyridoxamine 5'-phosphate oxidase family protein [Nonomuraea pusilla]|uniref:Pyridoxamine 5'-phosphate oxidase n=1 Tax=Nonomuraea pusilla TaxID=46177 RepID=A0A1H7W3X5_9ACTN|nr:pyridoxamine 5'-phosphate oxidase family protein [Nonomuraea pusilla]SEM16292.1 Pyridoxamine 5'-phosphate oxidase [Nonomuraea pusilla]
MHGFSDRELSYLREHDLARLATATPGGAPHVVPVRIHLDEERGVIGVGSRVLPGAARPRRYRRQVEDNPQVALVVDDFAESGPRGLSIHGLGRVHTEGGERLKDGFEPVWVEIMPVRISSWGIDSAPHDPPRTRIVGEGL